MEAGVVRDIAVLVVPRIGRVVDGTDGRVPFGVVDAAGQEVPAVSEFLREMAACDASPATLRSYCYELLGWLRFLSAVEVTWDRATRAEARDYALWLAQARKPERQRRSGTPAPGTVNAVTGKSYPGSTYAVATRRHARTVVHAFYEYHRSVHGSPLLNPFPADRYGSAGQVNVHHNPMRPWLRPSGRRRISRRRHGVFPGRSRMSSSTSCSPRWRRTGTGRCWRFGSRLGRGRENC